MRSSDTTSRPRSATISSWFDVMSADRSELAVCTMVPCAVSVTVSDRLPTFSCTAPIDNCSFAGTTVFLRSNGEKPLSSMRTV